MKQKKDINPINWSLIASIIYNSDLGSEKELLEKFSELNKAEKKELQHSVRMDRKIGLFLKQYKFSEEKAFNKLHKHIHKQELKSRRLNMFMKVAAILILAILSGAFVYQLRYSETFLKQKLEANNEVISSYNLPDGTLVALNRHSKLYYPKQFSDQSREVIVEGEAFFNVLPDPTKPFVINAGKAQIKVLGTSFNVNAFPDADQMEVVVKSGRVVVSRLVDNGLDHEELILRPGDKGILIYATDSLLKRGNQDPNYLSWRTRQLIFRATSLPEAIEKINDIYGVEIKLADKKLNQLRLTAQFHDYSVEFIMGVIGSTLNLEVVNEDEGHFLLREKM